MIRHVELAISDSSGDKEIAQAYYLLMIKYEELLNPWPSLGIIYCNKLS